MLPMGNISTGGEGTETPGVALECYGETRPLGVGGAEWETARIPGASGPSRKGSPRWGRFLSR